MIHGAMHTNTAYQDPLSKLSPSVPTVASVVPAKTATSPTDHVNTRSASGGFTLLELVVVLLIAGLLFALGAPRVGKLYDSMQYREAVRELVSAAKNARRDAFASGQPMDLLIDTSGNRYVLTHQSQEVDLEEFQPLSATLDISVVYAVEVSPRPGLAAIRFYPAGGSSGGEIKVIRPSGAGVKLTIDWLLGAVTQELI